MYVSMYTYISYSNRNSAFFLYCVFICFERISQSAFIIFLNKCSLLLSIKETVF